MKKCAGINLNFERSLYIYRLPKTAVKKFARSKNPFIRTAIASNPYTSDDVLDKLRDDDDDFVMEAAWENSVARGLEDAAVNLSVAEAKAALAERRQRARESGILSPAEFKIVLAKCAR